MKKSEALTEAEKIYAFVKEHKDATRPEMFQATILSDSFVESIVKRMVLLKMLVDTGRKRKGNGPKACNVFAIGPRPWDMEEFHRGGRHPAPSSIRAVDASRNLNKVQSSLTFLEDFIRASVEASHVDAQCEEDVHTGRGDDAGRPGSGLGGPQDRSAGERLSRDEGFIPGGSQTLPRYRP